MAGRLTFSIAINFLTENFRKGTNQVKSAFRSLQMQMLTFAAALGAGGLGLTELVSRFVQVARETNRVTTALKNVSGGMAGFADNQRFLLDMAKKYGLEINALTGNYAKFTAAASLSGMSMQEQRKIFESMSRAVTAFGMSAEDSNGVFLALSQMMSKGKISSEELRLQMGERLPIALQAMAKAAGTTVVGLDDLLKQGKLMSADVLPKFADALNEMIPNVDTDNLETSVNRLKNTFTELVNSSGVQSRYKGIVDWLTNLIKGATENIKNIVIYAAAAIAVAVTSRCINKIIAAIASAELAAKSAARKAARDAGEAFDEAAWRSKKTAASIKMAFSKAATSLKTLFISSIPTAVITIIGAFIAKLISIRKESERINNIYKEYQNRMSSAGDTSAETVKLKALQSEYNKANSSIAYKKQLLTQINGILGTELTAQQDVNAAITQRISLLESAARAELAAKEAAEAESQIRKIGGNVYNGRTVSEMAADWAMAKGDVVKEGNFKRKYGVSTQNGWGISTGLEEDLNSFIQYAKILKDARSRLGNEIKSSSTSRLTGGTPSDTSGKTDIQKAEEEYKQSLQTYKNQLDAGAITQESYNSEVDKLNKETVEKLAGILGKAAEENATYTQAMKGVLNPLVTEEAKARKELQKVEAEYTKKATQAKAQLDKKLITEDEYRNAISEAAMAAARSAVSIDGIGTAADEFVERMKSSSIAQITAPVLGKRDTTFDYKLSDTEKMQGELEVWKQYQQELEQLKQKYGELSTDLEEKLNTAIRNVDSLEEQLKIAQIQEDLKELDKQFRETAFSGAKDVVSQVDSMVSSFERLSDVFNDVDASGWEKFMAVWQMLMSTISTVSTVISLFEKLSAITGKQRGAQNSLTASIAGTIGQKAAEIAANEAAAQIELQTSRKKAQAAATEMAAKSTAAYAYIPFAGAGLAGAQIAAMTAMINAAAQAIPKFAGGGIVTGATRTGDKLLARVNSGEMILNGTQQAHLFNAINGGKLGSGKSEIASTVSTRVRGKDLILLINNELKSQGKKTL